MENRSFGTLAFEYDKEILRYEDAVRSLAILEREHRNISHYAAERDDAYAKARAIRTVLVKKLAEHDVRLGIRAA